ncbi:hypothetical protein [Catelliglobosispora koreensis]|uniref:hypothetical protein n=1 Tax=Catelliglobosispora koreensis TaxID=129052 RepID=UPI0007C6A255|nr:hypothetical protein [Catelliglobosispora koreensis]
MGAVAELGKWGVSPASSLTAPTEGLGTDRAIPVLAELRDLLPYRGLARGSTISVAGIGATSLMFALLAEATTRGSWAALVALPGLGLAAAKATGVALERIAVVPNPGPDTLSVAATLLDGFDLVVVGVHGGITASAASQMSARARKAGSVLVTLGEWPGANMTVACRDARWLSRGRLRCRELTVRLTGRGGAARPNEKRIWLPDDPTFRAAHAQREQARRETAGPVRRLRALP